MQAFATTMASRWAFEGLLVVESEERPDWKPPAIPGTTAEAQKARDLAETYFPEDGERLGYSISVGVLGGMVMILVVAIMLS